MGRTVEQYKNLLLSLLPKGKIWNREPNSIIAKVLKGLAWEFYRIEARAETLITESFVSKTSELITDHEEDFDLPEDGLELASTTAGRREDLLASQIRRGQQYEAYFEEIAEELGYTILIDLFTPFWAGVATAGSPCGDQRNLFFWLINIEINSLCDITDRIIEYKDANLSRIEGKMERIKPGHTHLLFDFSGTEDNRGDATKRLVEFSRAFSSAGFDAKPTWDNSWGYPEDKGLDFDRNFSSAFANNCDYDGVYLIGAFNQSFDLSYDRYSGGSFATDSFGDAFKKPK